MASVLTLIAAPLAAPAAPLSPATHSGRPAETSSSGWIDFSPHTNLGIFLPIKVDGHATMALLYGGPSTIDTTFAASIGLAGDATAGAKSALATLQVGALTLPDTPADFANIQAQANTAILGQPALFRIGEGVFGHLVVDIDYPHHRVAFRKPGAMNRPAGAIEVSLMEVNGQRVVPLSIDHAAPELFELELGNVIGPLLVVPAYAQAQGLLTGRPTSQRLSGRYSETTVSLDRLSFAGFDFRNVPIAIVPDPEVPPVPIAGGVGLPLLSKFRLIIDYPHNRLWAIPSAALRTPIARDRFGLVLARAPQGPQGDFGVAFVSPGSPAEATGFKRGDTITRIDGKPFRAWPPAAIVGFQMAALGTTHVFALPDGTTRTVKAADFF
jgi:hypothetical protein